MTTDAEQVWPHEQEGLPLQSGFPCKGVYTLVVMVLQPTTD